MVIRIPISPEQLEGVGPNDWPFPMTDVFEMIMDAQPSAGERFEAALRLVKTSDDPMTVASAALYAQKVVIGFCDPTFDLSKICTVNMARKHIEQMRRDPEVAERFNRYFVGI